MHRITTINPRFIKMSAAVPARTVTVRAAALEKIGAIEARIQTDPGNRGIAAFTLPGGELGRAAASLYRLRGTTEAAAIVTGFPCLLDFTPPTETDGPVSG